MFSNMKVGTRLLAGFIFIALMGSAVATIGIFNMASMNRQSENTYANDLLGLSAIKEANINLIYIGRAARGVLLARTPEERAKIGTLLDTGRRDMGKYLD